MKKIRLTADDGDRTPQIAFGLRAYQNQVTISAAHSENPTRQASLLAFRVDGDGKCFVRQHRIIEPLICNAFGVERGGTLKIEIPGDARVLASVENSSKGGIWISHSDTVRLIEALTESGISAELDRVAAANGLRAAVNNRKAEIRDTITDLPLGQEVIDLVVAAREVVYEQGSYTPLDQALEKFASIVPWDDEPESPAAKRSEPISFEITTGDPRFDPNKPVKINGIEFVRKSHDA